MEGRNPIERFFDGRLKLTKRRVIATVERSTLGELPQPFDQIQVRRIGGEEQQGDPQLLRQLLDRRIALVTGVVEYHRDRSRETNCGDLSQEFAHCCGVDDRRIGHGDQLACRRIPGTQDVEPLTTTGRSDKDPRERPQATQERAEHEMGCVNEEHMTIPCLSGIQTRLQFGVEEIGLGGNVLGQVFFGGTGIARTHRHFRPRSLRNLRT
jgi:hypothetical protein